MKKDTYLGLAAVRFLKGVEKQRLEKELQNAAARLHQLEALERQIQGYRQEYIGEFIRKAMQGMHSRELQYYRQFIQHLDDLLQGQIDESAFGREQLEELSRLWMVKHLEIDSLQNLQKKQLQQKKKEKQRRGQNNQNWRRTKE